MVRKMNTKRYTNKSKVEVGYVITNPMLEFPFRTKQAIDKLGQLEDIEEELGIDLITLLYKHPYAKHLLYNLIHNIPFVFAPKKEEQGKTWAFTKEELE